MWKTLVNSWLDVTWVLACLVLSSLWCLGAARELGVTFDEPVYIEWGLKYWRSGSLFDPLAKGTMPLPLQVCSLPVFLWERANGQPFDLTTDFDRILPVFRAGTLFFWTVLLLGVWIAANHLGGRWAARLAVGLVATEPTLLAHAALGTTDIALTACLLLFAIVYAVTRQGNWWWRVALPALFYGIALWAKASALVFGVLVMLGLEAERLWRTSDQAESWKRLKATIRALFARAFIKQSAQVVFLGLAFVFLVCGSDWQRERSFVAWASTLPEGSFATTMNWIADNLRIFNNAGCALARQIKHNMQGHGAYLLGHSEPRAIWYYFPVALTIKLTLTLLVLPLVLAVTAPRHLANSALLLTGIFLLFSLNCRVQIGIRMILPLIVFACVGFSVALVHAAEQSTHSWRRLALAGSAVVGLGWAMWSVINVYPHGISYVNELYGGTQSGYRLISGSDYDWGQGVPELARRQAGHPDPIHLLYYGTDPTSRDPHFLCVLPDSVPPPEEGAVRAFLQGRDLAVSVCMVHGPRFKHARLDAFLDYLRTRKPVDRTTTFLIYRFEPTQTARR